MAIEQAETPPPSEQDDAAIAARLAAQVEASADGVTWRKTTTLLDLFGAYRLTSDVRARIAGALEGAGLDPKPPIDQVQRFETIRLSLHEDAVDDGHDPRSRSRTLSRLLPIDDVLEVTEWRPGQPPERKPLFACEPGSDAVRWFHIDVIHTEPDMMFEALSNVCPGLTLQMVVDLFTVDPRPHVHSYTDEPHLRMVSAFAVTADESEEGASDAEASKAGALVFQLVEMLAGDGWMITCWHRSKRYAGAEEIAEGPPEGREEVMAGVQRWWLAGGGLSTAGDLATLVLHELVLTYPSAARVMNSWLEQWELDFHRRYDQTERHTLIDVRSLLAELEERLRAIERPEADPEDAWFTGLSGTKWAHRVQKLVDRALSDLGSIHGTLRASLDLLGVHSAAQQLKLAQHQAAAQERLQGALALITSVLLVPTFIAGFFGSNTAIPGQGQWWGFILMVVLMVVGATGAWLVIRPRRHK